MRKRFGIVLGALALSCIWVTDASAATEVGNNCTAASGAANVTAVQLSQAPGSSSLPPTVPSAGVVTKWKVNLVPTVNQFPMQLKVFRSTAAPKRFLVVGESGTEAVGGGSNSFDTRIAVEAGDRFGTFGGITGGSLFCVTASATDVMGATVGGAAVGATQEFSSDLEERLVAVAAVVEPDADKDGYGDETQDKCPESAGAQAPCPALLLDAVSQAPGRKAVTILVASSSAAAITVSASVKIPSRAKKADASAQARLAAISQIVVPGKIAVYKLTYTKPIRVALKALPRSRSLKLKVSAAARSLAGVDSV